VTNLWDVLTGPAQLAQSFLTWEDDRFARHTVAEELERARRVAAGLHRRGVRPGDVVPAVITNGPDATPGFAGIWVAGATIASLPIIARGMSIEAYVAQLDRLCAALGADFFLAEERFVQFMPPGTEMAATPVGYRELIETEALAPVELPDPATTAFVQYSSGTTGEPRGVALTGDAIQAQLDTLVERLALDPERDRGYTWLPHSHDMGFFGGTLLVLYSAMSGIRATPERFLGAPRSWLDDCAEHGATITAGPPSALELATRAERIDSAGTPLRLRVCLTGAEQVEWETLEGAAEAFAPRGLRREAFTVAYGLAEATLAVTIGDPDAAPRYLDVDPATLAHGGAPAANGAEGARRIVSTGRPVPGTRVEIDPDTGEIAVASPSLAAGYHRDPEATAERFTGGAVRTRDLGFLHDGELYVTGRSDDLVIVGGRNVHVLELEHELGQEPAIRTGNCAIVDRPGEHGRARVALVAELKPDAADADDVAGRLRRVALERVGLVLDEVVFVAPGAFPKTPSGKVQRYRCRELIGRGAGA
jgi:acyl-CoA synthetase (AMP-forming)/AMP-acid ligase II